MTRAPLFLATSKDFSALSELSHPAFFEVVLGGFAEAIEGFGAQGRICRDRWGWALPRHRRRHCGRGAVRRAPQEPRCRPGSPRRGCRDCNCGSARTDGPVFPGRDPVTRRDKFFGKEVVRTARIEPVTPPGETYVTEQFAAEAAAGAPRSYSCEYVGRQPMAKGYGECRMYALRFFDT